MRHRMIGEVTVGAIGLGAMELSVEGRPDESQAIRTIHAALDAGVTLIDTADAYCLDGTELGHNERLVAAALARYTGDRDAVLVATKGGHTRDRDGSWELNGRPDYLKRACAASLTALGGEAIGLYQFHRPDPAVPFAESIGALAELLDEGKIRMVGVSNANVEQIDTARRILGGRLASVQNQFSPGFRSSEPEVAHCAEHGIAFLVWSPFGGLDRAGELAERHPPFRLVAAERGVSAHQVCLAWLLAKAPVVVPIPGSRRPETIRDSAAAADLRLAADELVRLDGR